MMPRQATRCTRRRQHMQAR